MEGEATTWKTSDVGERRQVRKEVPGTKPTRPVREASFICLLASGVSGVQVDVRARKAGDVKFSRT